MSLFDSSCICACDKCSFGFNYIGRILNRFSKDIGFLDDLLPYVFCEFLLVIDDSTTDRQLHLITVFFTQLLVRTTAIVLTAIVANPVTLVSIVFLLAAFIALRWYYVKSARDIKRLEALCKHTVNIHSHQRDLLNTI